MIKMDVEILLELHAFLGIQVDVEILFDLLAFQIAFVIYIFLNLNLLPIL